MLNADYSKLDKAFQAKYRLKRQLNEFWQLFWIQIFSTQLFKVTTYYQVSVFMQLMN